MVRNTLICTVGTSLFEGNLARLSEDTPDLPENWKTLKEYFESKNWSLLTKEMLKLDPTLRVCGAEINTIEESKKKGFITLEKLYFLVSDTEYGKGTGEFLKKYYSARTDLDLKMLDYFVVGNLQDERPLDFKIDGLRNLVREASKLIRQSGGPRYVAINATGGYKAQIAVAVILGQVLSIPVLYQHEKFPQIIDFPPLPVSFDYDLLGENADLLARFENGETLESDELGEVDDRLRVLLEEIDVNSTQLFGLGAVGQIFIEGFRVRNPKPPNLVDAGRSKKGASFREDHYPVGFEDFVRKVWREVAWVVTARSLPYDRQRSIRGTGFSVKEIDGQKRLIGHYEDHNNFGARFRLHLTDESSTALTWAAMTLNEKYASSR